MYRGDDYAQQAAKASLENARAIERMKESKRQVDELGTSIARLDMIVCAMWELMQENGIPKEALYEKLDNLIQKRKASVYRYSIIDCPKCGKPIQESNKTPMLGRCVYCGQTVTFYPYSTEISAVDDDEAEDAEPEPVQEEVQEDPKPYDITDDLGF